ncbi:hypothetical protein GGS21DRAFT_493156 [Xylaria nigripes]|nr:hypothetical protein GGS21DRAFT_493156 [Xylaria nigripes]
MTSLNQMPVEILEDIIHRVISGTSRVSGQLAAVNSVWQRIVEKSTFQSLRLTEADLPIAVRILRNRSERFGLVRLIVFNIILPGYSAVRCTMTETSLERIRNDLAFSGAINTLVSHLGIISEWPASGRTLELQLYPMSPADERCTMVGNYGYRFWFGAVPGDLLHYRTYGSLLQYRGIASGITTAPAVTKLTLRNDCERYLSPASIHRLFQIFPKLREIDIRFWDLFKHDPEPFRRLMRQQMASVLDTMPESVSSMKCHVEYYPPADHDFQGQNVCDIHGQTDSLTVAYRNATQKMAIVSIHGMLGTSELFWPNQVNASNPAPFWPTLKRMELYYHIHQPNGEWLFVPDSGWNTRAQAEPPFYDLPPDFFETPAEDTLPMQNRYTADQDKMDDFYCAVSKAICNMPKLEYIRAQALIFWTGAIVPYHVFEFKIDGRAGYATWSGIPPYEPSYHVIKAWRKMAYHRAISIQFESTEPTNYENSQQ